jgi:hypothetical protein
MPQATAAADPLDGSARRSRHVEGIARRPDRPIANSVVTVLPTMTAPPAERGDAGRIDFGRHPCRSASSSASACQPSQ